MQRRQPYEKGRNPGKSRAEGIDEGVEYSAGQGRKYGVGAMLLIVTILNVFNLYTGRSCSQTLAVFCAYLSAESYGMYRAGGKKLHLVSTVVAFAAALVFLSASFMEGVR